ncbi:DUF2975 domain-containing protein [Ruminococcus sp.]|uniref:DUF2975 domain-containing protein n=1 Tax=Ruminococcus sp. TaxID=41978 RepID=UPI001B3E6CF6|nr:DUF2975 domain-containing protein [Ruminococcus sp.]MBP5431207.1 DUF2975 domain-containing protein [Ruminococcus sp.]
MEITKLTSKIRNISRISVIGVIAYIVYYIYTYFPDAKAGWIDGWNESEEAWPDKSDWQVILYVLAAFVMLTALIITIVAALKLLFRMSGGASPFTEKVSRSLKNMGVALIVFEVTWDLLNYIDAGTVNIGTIWLAGLILYAFSLVFRYGAVLQKESDETL